MTVCIRQVKDSHVSAETPSRIRSGNVVAATYRAEELLDTIQGQEAVLSLADLGSEECFLPAFSIDYISRRTSAEAARHVLGRLSLLEIVSINKSISLTTGEVLRPDILCFNSETKTLVVLK